MELIVVPQALPGCCFTCRSAERKFFIDLQFNWEFHGAMYICSECLAEMAHMANYLIPEEVTKLKAKLQSVEEERDNLSIRVEGLEQALDGLRLAGSVSRSYSGSDAIMVVPSDTEGTSVTAPDLGEGEGESPEQVHDERVAEFPDDAGSEFNFNLGI